MGVVKKIAIKIFSFLYILLKSAYEKQYIDSLKKRCDCDNSTAFLSTANIFNYQKNPELIKIGSKTTIAGELYIFNYGGRIEIGNYCDIGENSKIFSGEGILIGNNVLISYNVTISDTNAHEIESDLREKGYLQLIEQGHPKEKGVIRTSPIIIEDNVWINFNVTILKGVTIGKGSVVSANSFVVKDVPEYSVVAGNPAKVIKYTK